MEMRIVYPSLVTAETNALFTPLWIEVCKKQKVTVYFKNDYYGNLHCNGQFIGLCMCSLCQQCQHLNKS